VSTTGTITNLLHLSELTLTGRIGMPSGRSARVAALLARSALEDIVDGMCRAHDLDASRASMRVKLACLRAVSADAAGDAAIAWWGLSRACHQHAYEIAPHDAEVAALVERVRQISSVPQSL